jgi:hypothetical protein
MRYKYVVYNSMYTKCIQIVYFLYVLNVHYFSSLLSL